MNNEHINVLDSYFLLTDTEKIVQLNILHEFVKKQYDIIIQNKVKQLRNFNDTKENTKEKN